MRFVLIVISVFLLSACGLFLDTDPSAGDRDAAVGYEDAAVDATPNTNR
jgi:hypothetical protein